jgi:flagella basal body P-ring formation protein FlgA
MRHLALLLAATLLLAAAPAAATSLKPGASFSRDTVTLGDLFADLPDGVSPEIVVGKAPPPGRKLDFNALQLQDIAAANQLGWSAPDRFVHVEIERAGRTIGREQIVAALRPALVEHGMPGDAVVTLDNELMRLVTPAEQPASIAIEDLTYDTVLGRFQGLLSTPAGSADAARVRVSGRTVQTILLPVPTRPIASGEIIRVTDLQLMRIRIDRAGNMVVSDPDRLIGRTAKRMLAAQEPIQVAAVAPTILVPKNSIALARVQAGRILITMEGKALDDGAQGDSIRIVNPRSNKIVQGIVTGPGEVTLTSTVSLAAN